MMFCSSSSSRIDSTSCFAEWFFDWASLTTLSSGPRIAWSRLLSCADTTGTGYHGDITTVFKEFSLIIYYFTFVFAISTSSA